MKHLLNQLTRRITNTLTTLRALPFVLFFWASMANNAFAAAVDITADFIDPAFLAKLRTELGIAAPTPIYDTDVNSKVTLDVSNSGITSLAGIQYFTALQYLLCSNNSLTSLNVSGLTALEGLYCSNNSLTALDVSGLTALERLLCGNNSLTALDVSGLTALEVLSCFNNSLTSLNVSGLTSLEVLECNNNVLTALDVSGLTALEHLLCNNNLLTSLNVSGLSLLVYLNCSNNRLTNGTLNITGCTLTYLNCEYNDMTPDPSAIKGVTASNPSSIFNYSTQNASGFRPVGGITGIPATIAAGIPFDLSDVAEVRPPDATNRAPIVWSIISGTGTLTGNILTIPTAGTFVRLRATITDGKASGDPYTQDFNIDAVTPIAPVGSFDIAPVPDQTYTGSAVRPLLTVTRGGKALAAGVDYTVRYANNVEVGTATATLIGIGGYSGKRSVTFQIVKPAKVGGQPLTPSEGTGAKDDPFIADVLTPSGMQALMPSAFAMTNDPDAVIEFFASPDYTHPLRGVDVYWHESTTAYVKITSLGVDYYYVLTVVAAPPTPPRPVGRLVTLPSVPGTVTYPPAGLHYAPNGGTFTFTLKPPAPGDVPTVTTDDDSEYITATPNADGTYTITVDHIYRATKLYIAFTTASASATVAPAQVWAHGHTLYIYATTAGTARIYGLSGQLVKAVPYAAGETVQAALPSGVYIVVANGRTYKTVISE